MLQHTLAWQNASGDERSPKTWKPFDEATRCDLVDTLARTIGRDHKASTLLKAARSLASYRMHPADVQARLQALATPSDGTMAPFPNPPEPMTARQHETKIKRNRKRTSFERRHIGKAQVIGDRWEPAGGLTAPIPEHWDDLTPRQRQALSCDLVALAPRLVIGADGLMLTRLADRHLADHGLEALIGTDPTAWSATFHGDRSDFTPVAVRREYMSASDAQAFNLGHESDLSWADRLSLSLRLRKSEQFERFLDAKGIERPAVIENGKVRLLTAQDRLVTRKTITSTRTIHHPAIHRGRWNASETRWDSIEVMPERTSIVEVQRVIVSRRPADRLFVGHQATDRPKRAKSGKSQAQNAATARVQKRTVGAFERPSTIGGYEAILESLAPGERAVIEDTDYRCTITRSAKVKNGKFNATVTDLDGKRTEQTRTVQAMAIRLAP